MKLNLNATVEFKVTAFGKTAWQSYIDSVMWEAIRSVKKPTVADVWRGQLWQAFRIFGPAMVMGFDPVEAEFEYFNPDASPPSSP